MLNLGGEFLVRDDAVVAARCVQKHVSRGFGPDFARHFRADLRSLAPRSGCRIIRGSSLVDECHFKAQITEGSCGTILATGEISASRGGPGRIPLCDAEDGLGVVALAVVP